MMEKCRLCHYQPLLLLYANPQGTPVNADSAPKKRICVNGAAHQLIAERGVGDGEKSPATSNKTKNLRKKSPFKSKKSLSFGDLTAPTKQLSRTPSNASDTGASSPGKEKRRPSFRRIGSAIMSAVNPALAVSHLKQGKKKTSQKVNRRSSTGSGSESSGDQDLIELG